MHQALIAGQLVGGFMKILNSSGIVFSSISYQSGAFFFIGENNLPRGIYRTLSVNRIAVSFSPENITSALYFFCINMHVAHFNSFWVNLTK